MGSSIVTTVAAQQITWAKPKLFYKHGLSGLVATSTASGYDIENVLNRLEVLKWISALTTTQYITFDAGAGEAVTADYIIIHGHNLNTAGATITLQYSDDNFSADTNDAFTGEAPTTDKTYLKEFTEVAERYWRLKIENATVAPQISIMYWGETVELEYCENDFDPNATTDNAMMNKSQTGFILGIYNKYKERSFMLSWTEAEADLYDELKDLEDTIGRQNFVIAWESDVHSSDVYLVYSEADFNNPYVRQAQYRNAKLQLKGRAE
jgi:hypothetical protein